MTITDKNKELANTYDDTVLGIRQLFGDYKNDKFVVRQLQRCYLAPMSDKNSIGSVNKVLAYMCQEINMFGENNKKDDRYVEVPAKMLMEEKTGTIIFLSKHGTEILFQPATTNEKGGIIVFNRYSTKTS